MKNVTKMTTKSILASMILVGGIAIAAPGDPVLEGTDATLKNLTLEDGRLYQHDTYGAQWALDTGSDGLWFVPKEPVEGTYSAPLKIRNNASANTLVVGTNDENNVTNGFVGIGTDTPAVKLDVQWSDSDTANTHNLVGLSVNNAGIGASDVGFSLENKETDFKWAFRTYEPSQGFAASKIGTGGTEFEVGNTGTDLSTTVVKMGGVVVFENGHLVNTSGNELASLVEQQSKMLAQTRGDLKAKDEKIALLEQNQKEQSLKIAQLETMSQKVAMMESIFTNLALITSKNTKTEKVSLNNK